MPRTSVMRFASMFCADSLRLFSTPHSRMRLPNMRKPMSSADLGAIAPAIIVTIIGKSMRVSFETEAGL